MTIKELKEIGSIDIVNELPQLMYGANEGIKRVSAIVAVTDAYDRTTFAHLSSDGTHMTMATTQPAMLPGDPTKAHTTVMDAFTDMAQVFNAEPNGKLVTMKYTITDADRESARGLKK